MENYVNFHIIDETDFLLYVRKILSRKHYGKNKKYHHR